ncbi:VWA domain-containing protein [Paenibacillus sp. PAMC21692]|uniref:VWA domain-containing protein n=1 Tax=Paenibacillus sp. PAMC21692 TaxID=2762320 RepID=UPI00164E22C1|nr:VWA domain-containing protein [Paenibacillus sp. PAMC21692]QNK54862.1 VWA domain-containing protein [Paenibacillus sp. PAMC21692]
MGISVEHALALWLLVPWAAYVIWMFRTASRLSGARKVAAISIRSTILLLVVLLLAQVQPYRTQEQRNVVFVADRSASMNEDPRIGQWIAEAWRDKDKSDAGGIVSFGLSAVVDRGLTSEALAEEDNYRFRTGLSDGYTDLAKGLQLAAAMLREQGGGRLVVLSDGSENSGDAIRAARMLKDGGFAVDVVPMASALKRDAALEELKVPASLKQGETFGFEITIKSTFSGEAELRIYQNDQQLSISDLQLEVGDNSFILQSTALEPGFHRFRAEIHVDGDEQAANNSGYAFSRVNGPPKVLIVEGDPGSSVNLEGALASSLIGFDTIEPEQLSQELAEYAAYDSIILNNVPATRIAEKPMEWLGSAVSDYGVGLMMLGGEQSYGLGGYFKTPIEDALPVRMDLEGRKKIPSLGLVLVIDRSGSMSDGKLELAKEAAIRTVELMRDEDTVGVVAFDSAPWWVVEPTKLSNREDVIENIQGIQPEGGTEIYTALESGYQGLLELEAERKHMILLTDGQSGSAGNYSVITDAMNDHLMTLSTVAVGDGADQALLQRLANDAKGRYYFTRDQSTLPAIFSRETVLMTRTYVVDGEFFPAIGSSGEWASLWKEGVPPLQAYIATTAKELAEVALWSPEGDPVLARWQYGSGRTVAWTSDVTGKWSPQWMQWESFPKLFAEWVKWTFPQFDSTPYRVSAEMTGGAGLLKVESSSEAGAGGNTKLGATIEGLAKGGSAEPTELMPVAPGQYEASIGSLQPGAYLAKVGELSKEGQYVSEGGQTAGLVIPYSPEYRIQDDKGGETLARIASLTGGRELGLEDALLAFRGDKTIRREAYDWTREMLITILLLWLLDIAVRRLSIPWRLLVGQAIARLQMRSKVAGRADGRVAPPTATALQQLKRKAAASSRFYGADDNGKAAGVELTKKQLEGQAKVPTGMGQTTEPKFSSQSESVLERSGTRSTAPPVQSPSSPGSVPKPVAQHELSQQEQSRQSDSSNKPRPPASQSANPSSSRQPDDAGTMNRLLAAKNRSNNRGGK